MFKLLRYSSFFSLLFVAIAVTALLMFSQRILDQTLLEHGQAQNRFVVGVLGGQVEQQTRLLFDAQTPHERTQAQKSVDRVLTERMRGAAISHLALYDKHGQLLYRSNDLLDATPLIQESLPALLNGQLLSTLFKTEKEPFSRQVLSWIPLHLYAQAVDTVLLVATDVSGVSRRIENNHYRLAIAGGLLLLLLYGSLLIVIKALRAEHLEQQRTLVEQRRIKRELEQQALERTQTLRKEIEERRDIEHSLREQEAYLQAVMANIFNAIVCIDKQGQILSFNPTAERMFGYTQEQVQGENVSCLMPETHAHKHDGYIERYLVTGQAGIIGRSRQLKGLRQDGSEFSMELAITEASVSNEPIFIGTIRDISDQLLAEKALIETRQKYYHQEKMAAIGFLSAGLVHEIGNPVAALSGLLDGVCDPVSDELSCSALACAQLKLAQDQVERIIKITRDVSEFATPQTQECQLQDLNNLIGRTCRLMRHDRRFTGVELMLSLDSQIPAIYGVGDHLVQVLMNLLVNAVDAVSEGDTPQPLIRVRSGVEGEWVWFEISDNGCGMDADVLAQAREVFFTTKLVGSGTGLGLSLCESLLSEQGGVMTIQSQAGQGTQVRVMLSTESVTQDSAK